MSILKPWIPDDEISLKDWNMISKAKNQTFDLLTNEYKVATVSTKDPFIEQYIQENSVCEQWTLWFAYKENGVIRNNTPQESALYNSETGKIISSEYHQMYKLWNAFVWVKVERNSQWTVIEWSQTYYLVTPDGREWKQFLWRVDVISGFNLAKEFHKQWNNTGVNLFALDNLKTPLEENVDPTLSFLNEKYGAYKSNEPQDSINKKVFPKEKVYTEKTNTADRYTVIDKQWTIIYDIPRNNWAPLCRLAYNANDTRVEINQWTQSIAIHIPSSKKIISEYWMNMHIKGKFLIDFINNYDCIVYDADWVKLPWFVQELQNNEHRMIALKNENKLQLLDTMTGEFIAQEFDTYLRTYTNDDWSMTYIVKNNNTLIAIHVY
jgi:hypothetical protein